MADLYSLLIGDDDNAQAQAQALAAALGPQRQMGMLAQLSGDRRLAPIGQSLMGAMDQREQAIQQTMTGRLTRAMEMERQRRGLEAEAQRQQAGFAFEGGQNALNRALRREEFGATQEAARKKAEADEKQYREKMAMDLRKEFEGLPQTKRFQEASEGYKRIEAAGATGAGDMNLLYGFLKVLDPGSTVRESEFRSGAAVGGLPGIVEQYRNVLLGTGMLPPEARSQIRTEAARVMSAATSSFQPTVEQYRGLSGKSQVDAGDVLGRYSGAPTSAPEASGGSGPPSLTPKERRSRIDELLKKDRGP